LIKGIPIMISEERRNRLLEILRQEEALAIADASRRLRVSRMTVHRDLETLAAAGLLRKVHGGAVPVSPSAGGDRTARPFRERRPAHAAAKGRIAQHLARLLEGARTIALDASSTLYPLAHILPAPARGRACFIITNGIPLFLELRRRGPAFHVALTGGEPHPRTDSLVGPLAVKSLEGLRFDIAVVSAAGVMEDEGAVFDSTAEGPAVKQAFLVRATRRVLAIDRSKLGNPAPYPLGALADFDLLVTEDGPRELPRRRAR
jgi:DeoR family transcriptional regulator, aga operon transcriptional repressor